ncbi:MAG: 2Fe-2S iron-sulfur cluster-binding protein [Myxococcota bacterium]
MARTIRETHDAMSIVLEIPEALRDEFRYRAGQFLSFKVPYQGRVLTRSYSLASSPDTDGEPKVTVKRVDDGRISNWMNDEVRQGTRLQVVPPAGLFVLKPERGRDLLLFAGGSGITPCISIIKTALATTERRATLVYANRDARSIIFERELLDLAAAHPGRLDVVHSLDDRDGFLTAEGAAAHARSDLGRDFFLCGPTEFMDTVEAALHDLGVARDAIHIERFLSPPDHDEAAEDAAEAATTAAAHAGTITIVLDGKAHQVPYEPGERVLAAARRAGLEPPFSCEEGYCSCCMAKLTAGEVKMITNDCLTPDLLEEGWVLTCQSQCVGGGVKVEYPD